MFLLVVVSIRPLLERLLLPVVECTYPHAAALYVRWMIGLVDDDIGLQMQRASTSTQVNIEVNFEKSGLILYGFSNKLVYTSKYKKKLKNIKTYTQHLQKIFD